MLGPVANLLQRITGENFRYVYMAHWPGYIEDMRNSRFSLLFDEPHFVGWRLTNRLHVPLVRLSGKLSFVIVSRRSDESIVQLSDIAGHSVCAAVPPALGGLILFERFDNPSRQPRLRPTPGFGEAYDQLVGGHCRAAVLPSGQYETLADRRKLLRVLYLSEAYPNWALSVDKRIPSPVVNRIRDALLDPGNGRVADAVTGEFGPGIHLLPANEEEYKNHSRLLDDYWGLQ